MCMCMCGRRVMRFTSWWTEKKNKRHIKIAYFMDSEQFEIQFEGDEDVYATKQLHGKFGPVTR
jgi:hypothetical protein